MLGNGLTRNYPDIQLLLNTNAKRVSEAYKLVYACNRAVHDEQPYDYYVLKHRVFMSAVKKERLSQIYLPSDIFLDYKDLGVNMLPYVGYFDSGASAAYLAAFDGHKKVFLVGFDGDTGRGYKTVYDGTLPYEEQQTVFYDKWRDYLLNVMSVYQDVEFFRIQMDGQESPPEWRALPNYRDVSLRQAVLFGDF